MISPLPIKNGLNPTRVQVPMGEGAPIKAIDFVSRLIFTQRHRHPEDNEDAVRQRFSDGLVRFDNGQEVAPDDLVRPGIFINFYRRPAPEREVPGALELIYEDNDLLVVNKPSFLATLPRGQHITQTALTKARVQFGISELSPCHRLDRLTRGVLMFTKRPEIRGAYQTMFDRREPQKVYEAITDLPVDPPPWLRKLMLNAESGGLSQHLCGRGAGEVNRGGRGTEAKSFDKGGDPVVSRATNENKVITARATTWQSEYASQHKARSDTTSLRGEKTAKGTGRIDTGLALPTLDEVVIDTPWRERCQPTTESPWVLGHHMVKIRGRLNTYLDLDATADNAITAITGVRVVTDTVSTSAPTTRLAWRLEPHSGRTHQLRVVMRSLGLPIVNDALYGFICTDALLGRDTDLPSPPFAEDEDFNRPMGLTAAQLTFTDPISGEVRTFRVPDKQD
nr:pseudouridine synthase [Corynebacterium auriscanis]